MVPKISAFVDSFRQRYPELRRELAEGTRNRLQRTARLAALQAEIDELLGTGP